MPHVVMQDFALSSVTLKSAPGGINKDSDAADGAILPKMELQRVLGGKFANQV